MPEKRRRQPWERDMRVRIRTRPSAAEAFDVVLTFIDGYCTEAPPPLDYCRGVSLCWAYGHIQHRRWYSDPLPEPALALF